jgi:hypothetical protein
MAILLSVYTTFECKQHLSLPPASMYPSDAQSLGLENELTTLAAIYQLTPKDGPCGAGGS